MRKLYKVKQTYTIQEAAERLSLTLGEPITETDILRLMGEGEIGIFWWLPSTSMASGHDSDFPGGERVTEYKTGVFRIAIEKCSGSMEWARALWCNEWPEHPIPFWGTPLEDGDGAIRELGHKKVRQKDADGAREYWFSSDSTHPTRNQVIVTKKELDRFESQFNNDSGLTASVTPADISSRERESLHKQIAALALALAEQSNKYKNGDRPNGNQIAEAASAILEAMPDARTHGSSKSAIRASIKAGIDLLNG